METVVLYHVLVSTKETFKTITLQAKENFPTKMAMNIRVNSRITRNTVTASIVTLTAKNSKATMRMIRGREEAYLQQPPVKFGKATISKVRGMEILNIEILQEIR